MRNVTLGQLPDGNPKPDDYIMIFDGANTVKTSLSKLAIAAGYPKNVLEKCDYCEHWGAVMCACPQCGAPIDPKG